MSSESLTSPPAQDPLVVTTQPTQPPNASLEPQSLMCASGCDCHCHGQVVTVQPTADGVGQSISQTVRRNGCPMCQGQLNAAEVNKSVKNDLMTTDIPHNRPDNLWLCCYVDSAVNDGSCWDCGCGPSSEECCPGCGDDECCGEADGCECGDCCGELCTCCVELCSGCGECCGVMASCCGDS